MQDLDTTRVLKSFAIGNGLEYGVRVLNPGDGIKAKRRQPEVSLGEFQAALGEIEGRWFYSAVLNGWPALTQLEVLSIKVGRKTLWNSPRLEHTRLTKGKAAQSGKPFIPESTKEAIVTMRAPDYTFQGYEQGNPGYLYWVDATDGGIAKHIAYGQEGLKTVHDMDDKGGVATKVHMFGHRYAKRKETFKDQLSYHTGVLVEWDHQEYSTVIELAWLNGISAYKGNSNYITDAFTHKSGSSLFKMMPEVMVAPWHENRAELRMFDLPWKGVKEMVEFMKAHKGKNGRFIDPKIRGSDIVRLENATRATIYEALLNYIKNDGSYAEFSSWRQAGNNCQTFAASLKHYLSNKYTRPFTRAVTPIYNNRKELFEG